MKPLTPDLDQQKKAMRAKMMSISYPNSYLLHNPYLSDFLVHLSGLHESIGCYHAIKPELSIDPIIRFYEENTKILCFPYSRRNTRVLSFHPHSTILIHDEYNVPAPYPTQTIIYPTLVFVPCVAFDEQGYRLGRGKGCYDATIEFLKTIHQNLTIVGVARDEQKVDLVPHDKFDQKIDFIVTQSDILKINQR